MRVLRRDMSTGSWPAIPSTNTRLSIDEWMDGLRLRS